LPVTASSATTPLKGSDRYTVRSTMIGVLWKVAFTPLW
jgi:hypothetical protein